MNIHLCDSCFAIINEDDKTFLYFAKFCIEFLESKTPSKVFIVEDSNRDLVIKNLEINRLILSTEAGLNSIFIKPLIKIMKASPQANEYWLCAKDSTHVLD